MTVPSLLPIGTTAPSSSPVGPRSTKVARADGAPALLSRSTTPGAIDEGVARTAKPKLETEGTSRPFVPPNARVYQPVTTTERAYRHAVAEELRKLTQAMPVEQRGRWLRRVLLLRGCGENVLVLRCQDCGISSKDTARILMSCGMRVCPCCARARANKLRHELMSAAARTVTAGFEYYMITFTRRFDPSSLEQHSVEGLRRRLEELANGVKYVWRSVLKAEGTALVICYEVAPGGAVHAHALFYGPRPDIEVLRTAWLMRCPDSPQVNIKPKGDAPSAVLEVVKYIAKAASPKYAAGGSKLGSYTHPKLAAAIEVAFYQRRLHETLGAWRGLKPKRGAARGHDPETCSVCDSGNLQEVVLSRATWNQMAPLGWKPRFTRQYLRRPRSYGPAWQKGAENEHEREGRTHDQGVAAAARADGARGGADSGVNHKTVRAMIDSGELAHVRVRRNVRIPTRAILSLTM